MIATRADVGVGPYSHRGENDSSGYCLDFFQRVARRLADLRVGAFGRLAEVLFRFARASFVGQQHTHDEVRAMMFRIETDRGRNVGFRFRPFLFREQRHAQVQPRVRRFRITFHGGSKMRDRLLRSALTREQIS